MPAGSEPAAGQRRVFRPLRARLVVYPVAALVLAVMVFGAVVAPVEGTLSFAIADRVALVVLGLVIAYALHRLADTRAVATDAGLEVVNIVRRTHLEWAQVVDVRLSRDDPWVLLDISDGETLAVMGIQKADGERGLEQARELARMVAERTRTDRDD